MRFGKALKIHLICREKKVYAYQGCLICFHEKKRNCVMAPKNCKTCYEMISHFNLEMKKNREMAKKRLLQMKFF